MPVSTTQQPSHNIVVTLTVEVIGVGLIAILAGINDEVGNVMVVFMSGLLLIWAIMHTAELSAIVGKI